MSNWNDDLALGEAYQRKFLEIYNITDWVMPPGKFKPYDIQINYNDGTSKTVEVKCDRKTVTTENMVIEFECNGQASGITSTTANFWAYFIVGTNEYYVIPTSRIRKCIKSNLYQRTVKGGDGYRANMYLFHKSTFEKYLKTY